MHRRVKQAVGLALIGAVIAGAIVVPRDRFAWPLGMMRNYYLRLVFAPAREIHAETAKDFVPADLPRPSDESSPAEEWPSYNRTITSERHSRLREIDRSNARNLTVICTYDTKQHTSFQSGLLMVQGALIGTTEHDIFAIDAANCKENWRTREEYKPATPLGVNRGAAYFEGMLFRGTQDGRVVAYDFKTGKRLWVTRIADPELRETVPAAPIAWNGLVFVGNAGGAYKGVKGRMYALNARSGEIVWETYLVPKEEHDRSRGPAGAPSTQATQVPAASWNNKPGAPITGGATWTSYSIDPATGLLYVPGGNPGPIFAAGVREGQNLYAGSIVVLDAKTGTYRHHYKIVPRDWHDWDVSAAPSIVHTKGGKKLLAAAPKDGFLYGFDLATNNLIYRQPVTRMENMDVPLSAQHPTRFCPGSQGGAEWNGPAYDPQTNLIFVGEVDWCTVVTLQSEGELLRAGRGELWTGNASLNPFHVFGTPDSIANWAGWLYAVDADSGAWRWRLKSSYPIVSGVTPTAGGIVLFGDMSGSFHVVDAADGQPLWSKDLGGAIAGGVITYSADGRQRIAVAVGMTSILWPTPFVTAKIVILGLRGEDR